jgi:hypothetical protein
MSQKMWEKYSVGNSGIIFHDPDMNFHIILESTQNLGYVKTCQHRAVEKLSMSPNQGPQREILYATHPGPARTDNSGNTKQITTFLKHDFH